VRFANKGIRPDANGRGIATPEVLAIERSKYSLRVILLIHLSGSASQNRLIRLVPTSVSTTVRCLKLLETGGLVASRVETSGRRRRVYRLTSKGEDMVFRPPVAWFPSLRNP